MAAGRRAGSASTPHSTECAAPRRPAAASPRCWCARSYESHGSRQSAHGVALETCSRLTASGPRLSTDDTPVTTRRHMLPNLQRDVCRAAHAAPLSTPDIDISVGVDTRKLTSYFLWKPLQGERAHRNESETWFAFKFAYFSSIYPCGVRATPSPTRQWQLPAPRPRRRAVNG